MQEFPSQCRVCGNRDCSPTLRCANSPITSHFSSDESLQHSTKTLQFGFCSFCGTSQWLESWTQDEISSLAGRFFYREPEGHLDELADKIASLTRLSHKSTVVGVSEKDTSLISRLKERAVGLSAKQLSARSNSPNTYDLIIARHVIEHHENIPTFLMQLSKQIVPNGYLVLETPNAEDVFESGDFSQLWEEHFLYFTSSSLRRALNLCGWSPLWERSFPAQGIGESPLVMICQKSTTPLGVYSVSREEVEASQGFHLRAEQLKSKWFSFLKARVSQEQSIALFGAGHLSAMFTHYGGYSSFLDCVLDDTPAKTGKRLPGSSLEIYPTEELNKRNISLCLLGVSTESERKIVERLKTQFSWQGKFLSINPKSIFFPFNP